MDFAQKVYLMSHQVVILQVSAMLADPLQRQHVVLEGQQVDFGQKVYLMSHQVVMPQPPAMLADPLQRHYVVVERQLVYLAQ